MQELLTFVAKSLVDHPEQVAVHVTEGPEAVILELNVAEADMGKLDIPIHGNLVRRDFCFRNSCRSFFCFGSMPPTTGSNMLKPK